MQRPLFTYRGSDRTPSRDCPVFLPGWGFDGRVAALASPCRPWLTTNRPAGPAEILAGLGETVKLLQLKSVAITGWSLGARLALDFALAHPGQVSCLYLLAPRNLWPEAELTGIRREFSADPEGFLRTFYRKCFLGYRREYREFQSKIEAPYLREFSLKALAEGLDYLGRGELRDKLVQTLAMGISVYLLQGARDVIAPPDQAATSPGATGQFFPHGGHTLFLEEEFNPARHLRKAAIRRKFSRAANTYDDYAATQREAAERLAERLPNEAPGTILELGCGTGNLTRILTRQYPAARIAALDFSAGMVAVARSKVPSAKVDFICRDGELFLESCGDGYDLIVTNATLQWFDDLEQTLDKVSRCLTTGGSFTASLFGPASLRELRDGLAFVNPGVEIRLPVDDFPSRKRLETTLLRHFSIVGIEEWLNRRTYSDLTHLLRHIRRTGTTGPDRKTALLDRPRIAALDQWFNRELGEYRLTYQVFLVTCAGPGKEND